MESQSIVLLRHYGISTHTGESLTDALTTDCLLPDIGVSVRFIRDGEDEIVLTFDGQTKGVLQ